MSIFHLYIQPQFAENYNPVSGSIVSGQHLQHRHLPLGARLPSSGSQGESEAWREREREGREGGEGGSKRQRKSESEREEERGDGRNGERNIEERR